MQKRTPVAYTHSTTCITRLSRFRPSELSQSCHRAVHNAMYIGCLALFFPVFSFLLFFILSLFYFSSVCDSKFLHSFSLKANLYYCSNHLMQPQSKNRNTDTVWNIPNVYTLPFPLPMVRYTCVCVWRHFVFWILAGRMMKFVGRRSWKTQSI